MDTKGSRTPRIAPQAPRSCQIGTNGRRTSLRLEPEFEDALMALCEERGLDESEFFAEVRLRAGPHVNFSAAVRCAILRWFRTKAERPKPFEEPRWQVSGAHVAQGESR